MTYTIHSLQINPTLGTPIYRQIMDGIENMVATGVLKAGDRLPSVRELSSQLRINPSSAVKVYRELQKSGLINLDHGRGTFVSSQARAQGEGGRELLKREMDKALQKGRQYGLSDRDILETLEGLIKAGNSGRKK